MNTLEEKEVNNLKGDIASSMVALESQRVAFAQTLKNGLGEEIKNKLKNPDKPSWTLGVKLRWRRRWNLFKERIRTMANGGQNDEIFTNQQY